MSFDPHLSVRATIAGYFGNRVAQFPDVLPRIEDFFAAPSLETGRQLLIAYFRNHQTGDVASLRMATACFADKRLVRAVVDSILNDEPALAAIAARSYPHPIGFDKLVLHDDRATGFKLRLHIYWRGANFASLERLHLHRFEMASAIVTGELTNHIWRVVKFTPASSHLKGLELAAPAEDTEHTQRAMTAYAGYRRDPEGVLRKTHLGETVLERGPSETFTSGDAYAQILEDAHFVETNAETGYANGDFCSTVYIHGPSLADRGGRTLPILFEEQRLPDDDARIETIPAIPVEALRASLLRYRNTLDEILRFYDWLYHPKHGRNLSVGMVAGYLLCESFITPHAIDVFERRYDECKEVLQAYEKIIRDEIEGRPTPLSDDDRKTRYVRLLLAKASAHPGGPRQWLDDYGSLTREMWRYFGAIRGEVSPNITVLKPIWERVVKRKLPGGLHYGHISAMIEAAFDANEISARHFEAHLYAGTRDSAQAENLTAIHKDDYNVTSIADDEIEGRIHNVLKAHFPDYRFYGEEGGDADCSAPAEGARRFLVDPLDGTRNFLNRRQEFCTSIACQEWTGSGWRTTDGVVAHPASGRIFWAERGQGAFVIERNDYEHRVRVHPLAVDRGAPLRHQLIDFSARGLDVECQTDVFRALVNGNAAIRNSGSVALILANMAGRGGSGTILTAKDHDVEAGLLIAHEAGAWITQLDFEAGGGSRTATVVGADPRVHAALVGMLKELLAKHGRRVLRETLTEPAR